MESIKQGKPFMVLDVEGASNCRPYNIGYIIGDKYGNIYEKRSIAILPCIWENLQNSNSFTKHMTHKNIQEILNDIENNNNNNKYCYSSVEKVKELILKDCLQYRINEIWSYTLFDKSALKRLFQDDFQVLEKSIAFYDIVPAIVHTSLLNKKYVKWCRKNGYVTEKGNIQTKAEIVYRYLTGKANFKEEHTALSDSEIEFEILLSAINSGKKIDRKEKRLSWKVFKQFCEIENI